MRVRLLPGLIIAALLALSLRLGDLWDGVVAGSARAQTAAGSQPASGLKAVSSSRAANGTRDTARDVTATGTRANLRPAAGNSGSAAESTTGQGESSPAGTEAPAPRDPLNMSDEEIDLLTALSKRRVELEERARRIDEREALLQAAERRIDEKVQGLQALQSNIEELLKQQETQTEDQYRSLVKIYENMKPKDAARIFEELEMAVLLPVVERMKERKTAPILAKMDPVKAKAITTELAQRKVLPEGTK